VKANPPQLGRTVDNINTTAIEFGGLNLAPADFIKQPQKAWSVP
jgi:hypothetical protein